ncbi:MAG: sporulation protein YunB [Christensenellales bacterium]|jgi:sporulation protein YunB
MAKKLYRRRGFQIVLALMVLITGMAVYMSMNISPVLIAMAQSKVKALTVDVMGKSVYEIMGQDVSYTDLVHTQTDADGKVVMLDADILKLNRMAADIAITAQEQLKERGMQEVHIPLGSALGWPMVAGQGPEIPVKIQPVGAVETRFTTEFISAGINQTRHRILLEATAQVRIVVPLGAGQIEVNSTIPVAETIIVGDVPGSYVNVEDLQQMLPLVPRSGN